MTVLRICEEKKGKKARNVVLLSLSSLVQLVVPEGGSILVDLIFCSF
jgi:hypothetical protein